MSDDQLARIEERLEELVVGQAALRTELKGDFAELKGDVRRLDSRVDDLQRHMHVLHEDVIDRIKGLDG